MDSVWNLYNWKSSPPFQILSFIIMIMCREGGHLTDSYRVKSYIPWGDTVDSLIMGDMVTFGYFLIILAQFFGYMCAEIAMVQVSVILEICLLNIDWQSYSILKKKTLSKLFLSLTRFVEIAAIFWQILLLKPFLRTVFSSLFEKLQLTRKLKNTHFKHLSDNNIFSFFRILY